MKSGQGRADLKNQGKDVVLVSSGQSGGNRQLGLTEADNCSEGRHLPL